MCSSDLGSVNITPATLVPLGILVVVYYIIRGKKPEEAQRGGALPEFLQFPSLANYLNMMGISTLTEQTMLPLALILGKVAFDRYVVQQGKLMENVNKVIGLPAKLVKGTAEVVMDAPRRASNSLKKVRNSAVGAVRGTVGLAGNSLKKVRNTAVGAVRGTTGLIMSAPRRASEVAGKFVQKAKESRNSIKEKMRRLSKK